ncbi:hypothetical protein V8F20_012866 [Naviculisporaceae sp. PSN 640]
MMMSRSGHFILCPWAHKHRLVPVVIVWQRHVRATCTCTKPAYGWSGLVGRPVGWFRFVPGLVLEVTVSQLSSGFPVISVSGPNLKARNHERLDEIEYGRQFSPDLSSRSSSSVLLRDRTLTAWHIGIIEMMIPVCRPGSVTPEPSRSPGAKKLIWKYRFKGKLHDRRLYLQSLETGSDYERDNAIGRRAPMVWFCQLDEVDSLG